MEDYEGNERFKMGRSGMMRVLPENEYRFDPNEYDMYARMGYSSHRVAPSEMGRNWDKYLDARRHYNATKSDADRMEMSTSAKMHIGETIATLRDMWHDADPRPEGEDEERFLRFTSGNELTAKSWIVSL